jgi:hypothetical protein
MGVRLYLWYKRLRIGSLLLLILFFIVLANAVRQTPQPVMSPYDAQAAIQTMFKSVGSVSSIEYKQRIKTTGLGNKKSVIEMHYYYKKTGYLRVETNSGSNVSIDIYTPDGMYEYFPSSSTAYFREKWRDDSPLLFQLEEKLQDIKVRGKYDLFKNERIGSLDAQVIRSVYDDGGKIYEHRIWLAQIGGLTLPAREEYLIDGDASSVYEYEYISINKEISPGFFELKQSKDLQIFNSDGIPKLVKDEKEAEKYVKFNVVVPDYTPNNFSISEICVVPPAKTPSVLITYLSGVDTIYLNEKKTGVSELSEQTGDRYIKSGGRKFAIRKLYDNSISARWVKDGIEFEVSGPYTLKDEVVKITHNITGIWISLD